MARLKDAMEWILVHFRDSQKLLKEKDGGLVNEKDEMDGEAQASWQAFYAYQMRFGAEAQLGKYREKDDPK